jgi:hypothetical protein
MQPPDGSSNGPVWNPQPGAHANASTPFRPAPNDAYSAYAQVNAVPAPPPGARPASPQPGVIKKPRLVGLGLLALGVFLAGLNYSMLESEHRYYVKALFLTPFALAYGLFLAVFGQPLDPSTGKPKTWWRVGAGITLAGGFALGGLALTYVGC